jgi:hypothetical protein
VSVLRYTLIIAVTSRLPGKPLMPAGERCRIFTYLFTPPPVPSTSQTYLPKPISPPCRVFGPLLAVSAYFLPSISKAAPAMRLP